MKKTIAIECESIEDDSWGVGRLLFGLLRELASRPEIADEFHFLLLFKSKIPDAPFLNNPMFQKKLCKVPSFSLYYYIYLPIYLWFHRPYVTYFTNYMLPLIYRGKSVVMLTDDIYYEMRNRQLPFRYRIAYRIFAGWAARHATRIMAISESSKSELIKLFNIEQKRIFVNYPGIDTQELRDPKTTDYEPPTTDYVLFVGQMFPRRHAKETIEAFELIAPEFPDFKLILIGIDRYRPAIIVKMCEDLNKKLGTRHVLWKEYVPQEHLELLYKNARSLVYVSDREAFGLPPVEALSHGTIPIVADRPVSHEVLGGGACFVKDPITAESIVLAMREALTADTAKFRARSAATTVMRKFTWLAHTDKFLEMIRGL